MRDAIRRNHTATHLLHWALREVLGDHVKQQGSLVAPDRLRFDFSHFEALSPDEIRRIEDLVNVEVLDNASARHFETTKDHALEMGAIAFFGEKYGDIVRVLEAGRHSVELCGGTHVKALGDIGAIKIVSEGSIGSNLRRIEAVTGLGTLERLRDEEAILSEAAAKLGVSPAEVLEGLDKRLVDLDAARSEIAALRQQVAVGRAGELAAAAEGGVVVARVDGLARDDLRTLALAVRDVAGVDVVVVAGAPAGGGAALVVASSPDDARHAGGIVKELAFDARRWRQHEEPGRGRRRRSRRRADRRHPRGSTRVAAGRRGGRLLIAAMRVMGIDLGSKRVGIAVGDTQIGVATPAEVLERRGGDRAADRRALRDRVAEWEAGLLVVGLPLSMDGSDGPAGARGACGGGRTGRSRRRSRRAARRAALHGHGAPGVAGGGRRPAASAVVWSMRWRRPSSSRAGSTPSAHEQDVTVMTGPRRRRRRPTSEFVDEDAGVRDTPVRRRRARAERRTRAGHRIPASRSRAARRRQARRRAFAIVGALLVLLVALVLGAFAWYRTQLSAASGPHTPVELTVPRGAVEQRHRNAPRRSTRSSAMRRRSPGTSDFSGGGPFEAGRFVFRRHSSVDAAIAVLDQGPLPPKIVKVTIPEGFRLTQILDRIHAKVPRFSVSHMQAALAARKVSSPLLPPGSADYEGLLFPATYEVTERRPTSSCSSRWPTP